MALSLGVVIGCIGICVLLYHLLKNTPLPMTYELSDFPQMQVFHNSFPQILADCKGILGTGINHIHRERDVWSAGNNLKTQKFLMENKHIVGWVPAWAPGSESANYSWLNFPLLAAGHTFDNNLALCPHLSKLIAANKHIINICGFSLLKPGAKLTEHTDDTGIKFGSLAYHLGIIVPTDGLCDLTVNGVPFYQKPGQSIIFESTYRHSASNTGSTDRIILYIDFKVRG